MITALDEHLISFFTSTSYAAKNIAAIIGKRCHQGKVPKNQANIFPRFFFSRSSVERDSNLDGSNKGAYIAESFDLEVISNQTSDIRTLTYYLWQEVDGIWGSISDTKVVKGIVLDTQDDAYTPKGVGDDSGLDIASFVLKVIHAST